jgi:CheY-like chemotaxis protein
MVIFYADDDGDDRELFADAINEVNPDVKLVLATNGQEIIEFLENRNEVPDFIFLDLNMPGMSGKECLKRIKKFDWLKAVPIIIYTTTSNREEFKNLELLGATDCIVKEVTFKAIKDSLRNTLINFGGPNHPNGS